MVNRRDFCLAALGAPLFIGAASEPGRADLILHNGKIITVDPKFSIAQAVAIRGDRIVAVGGNDEVLKTRGKKTAVVDLAGKVVMPGLIDSHTHTAGAAMTEFDHTIPDMESVQDVLDYVKARADALEDGEWIVTRQIFITRLREMRYPTRAELDRAAPKNPVAFGTGPDASLNSLALQLNGIDRNFKAPAGVKVEVDASGEPTGIIRSYGRIVKTKSSGRSATEADEHSRLLELIKDYSRVGITSFGEKSASPGLIDRYKEMADAGELNCRVALSYHVDNTGPAEQIQEAIRKAAKHPLANADGLVRVIGIKAFLDGGMLTGSAYMRQPWGVSKIYAIDDPTYKGMLYIEKERLVPIVKTAFENGLSFTAHSVGDGAVHALLDAYEEAAKTMPIRQLHPCISHSNFMSKEAVEQAARLGVVCDIQPAWLYLDTRTLVSHFGYDRLRYFQPLRSIFEAGGVAGGGSDHMQKIGSLRSNNPYDPWLGMYTTITRRAKWYEGALHSEESLSREQAIRFYTINNAIVLRCEDKVGSIETGKLADLIVIDTDPLTCAEDALLKTKVLRTYVNGKQVF